MGLSPLEAPTALSAQNQSALASLAVGTGALRAAAADVDITGVY